MVKVLGWVDMVQALGWVGKLGMVQVPGCGGWVWIGSGIEWVGGCGIVLGWRWVLGWSRLVQGRNSAILKRGGGGCK